MPVPPDPSHSTSDRQHPRRPGSGDEGRPNGGDGARPREGLSGAAAAGADSLGRAANAGADRFWQEFSRARTERPRRGRAGNGDAPPEPKDDEQTDGHECLEWCPICRSADVLRAAGGPEVRNQIASLQRDSLLALRTLIDAYLMRSGPSAQAPWDGPMAHPGEAPPRPGDPQGHAPQRPGPQRPAEPPVEDIPLD